MVHNPRHDLWTNENILDMRVIINRIHHNSKQSMSGCECESVAVERTDKLNQEHSVH